MSQNGDSDRRLITRIVLTNFRSIPACDVRPGQLAFLVGPNGSGKSNFLDGLRFVSDSLRYSLDHALRDRGGINEVRRRSAGRPTHFGIRLEFSLPHGSGHYAFKVAARPHGAYSIQHEECLVTSLREGTPSAFYKVGDGRVERSTLPLAPAAARDRLYLVSMSGNEQFRPVYDALSSMGFYNLNPGEIRDLQPPDLGELLSRDGSNIASVLGTIGSRSPKLKKRIEEYLAKVVPGISGVERLHVGGKETLEFRQEVSGSKDPWKFFASNMSDGTLRALGVLVALFQNASNGDSRRLVGIEEPEVALHPAAAGVLTDSLQDAKQYVQIIVTSHSPDLLDNLSLPDDAVFAVVAEKGETRIGRLDSAGRSALKRGLYTAGELLRMDQLRPDPAESEIKADQLSLFGPEA